MILSETRGFSGGWKFLSMEKAGERRKIMYLFLLPKKRKDFFLYHNIHDFPTLVSSPFFSPCLSRRHQEEKLWMNLANGDGIFFILFSRYTCVLVNNLLNHVILDFLQGKKREVEKKVFYYCCEIWQIYTFDK